MEKKPLYKVLYLFSGRRRQHSVASFLHEWSKKSTEFTVEVEEWDIANGKSYNLLPEAVQEELLARIAEGQFDAIVMSPPCGTWSRAPWANTYGPRPLRSLLEPWGFPWLEGPRQQKVADSNSMIMLCIKALLLLEEKHYVTAFLLEHPEDLGAVMTFKRKARQAWFQVISKDVRPASIWQLPEIRRREHHPSVSTQVFHQCLFGSDSPKPTRILTIVCPTFKLWARLAGRNFMRLMVSMKAHFLESAPALHLTGN